MSTELRDYQLDLQYRTRVALSKHRSVLVQSPTGSGKSKLFIHMGRLAAAAGFTVLMISEAIKIFEQLSAEYSESHSIDSSASLRVIYPSHCYVAMSQTLARRPKLIEQFQALGRKLFIINDEAHIGTQTKLLKLFPDALLAGFTATPAWKWARHISELYETLEVGLQVRELIEMGWLCNYKHYARKAANTANLKTGSNGDYSEESQAIAFETESVYSALIEDLSRFKYKKCMIFCSSVNHANLLTKVLVGRGVNAVEYHRTLPNNVAKYNIKQFRKGDVDVCVSVGSLTKGFDFPPIDLVILMRATRSLPLYLQMIGRASRPLPDKKWFTCIDYGANYKRFGFWSDDRDWKKLWLPIKSKEGEGVAPIKICPDCEYVCPSVATMCPNCGHVFIKEKPKDVPTVLVELQPGSLVGKFVGDLSAYELAEFAKQPGKRVHAIRVAKSRELSQPGFLLSFATAMGYKEGWVDYQEKQLQGLTTLDFANTLIR